MKAYLEAKDWRFGLEVVKLGFDKFRELYCPGMSDEVSEEVKTWDEEWFDAPRLQPFYEQARSKRTKEYDSELEDSDPVQFTLNFPLGSVTHYEYHGRWIGPCRVLSRRPFRRSGLPWWWVRGHLPYRGGAREDVPIKFLCEARSVACPNDH
ncbi:MAG: hypothetical protein WC551_10205 [Patescibacteria group bacterium]